MIKFTNFLIVVLIVILDGRKIRTCYKSELLEDQQGYLYATLYLNTNIEHLITFKINVSKGECELIKFDMSDRKIIIKIPSFDIQYDNSDISWGNLVNICSCRNSTCFDQELVFNITISNRFRIQCNGNRVVDIFKYSRSFLKEDKNLTMKIYFGANGTYCYFSAVIQDIMHNYEEIRMQTYGNIVKCVKECTPDTCHGGICHEPFGKSLYCDCSEVAAKGKFCNETFITNHYTKSITTLFNSTSANLTNNNSKNGNNASVSIILTLVVVILGILGLAIKFRIKFFRYLSFVSTDSALPHYNSPEIEPLNPQNVSIGNDSQLDLTKNRIKTEPFQSDDLSVNSSQLDVIEKDKESEEVNNNVIHNQYETLDQETSTLC